MSGHACLDSIERRQFVISCLFPSPSRKDNAVASSCRLWKVSWDARILKLRRAYIRDLADEAFKTPNPLLQHIDDLEDIM